MEILVLGAMLALLALAACGLALSLRRDRLGRTLHSHVGGEPHVHWHGDRPHSHPTPVERYDAFLSKVLGPTP
ncbi:MAG TPA: hypothetical protein VFK41_07315 [Nocardioidaceae bacterium]|nr:hypothetical protein [Nocardioidaceae bacterium]